MRNRLRPRGFNFTEVLFAVMILGVGFIMVAAIFPVALMQTKQTQEESAAAGTARGGANYLEQLATNAIMPATGYRDVYVEGTPRVRIPGDGIEVHALDLNASVRGGMLLSADQRYAWIPFYRREGTRAPAPQGDWSSVAQVYMIPVAVRNRSQFDKGVPAVIQTSRAGPTPAAAIGVPQMVAKIMDSTAPAADNPDQIDCIEFANEPANNTESRFTAVAEGAYVIVAAAPLPPPAVLVGDPTGARARVGHIFRIGNPTQTQPDDIAQNNPTQYPRRWELVPGNDYVPLPTDSDGDSDIDITPASLPGLSVFVVGRSKVNPNLPWDATDNQYEGTSQDVAAYTTFVNIR